MAEPARTRSLHVRCSIFRSTLNHARERHAAEPPARDADHFGREKICERCVGVDGRDRRRAPFGQRDLRAIAPQRDGGSTGCSLASSSHSGSPLGMVVVLVHDHAVEALPLQLAQEVLRGRHGYEVHRSELLPRAGQRVWISVVRVEHSDSRSGHYLVPWQSSPIDAERVATATLRASRTAARTLIEVHSVRHSPRDSQFSQHD